MSLFDRLRAGLERSRETLNEIFYMGGEIDEDFWSDLEDALVMSDMGAELVCQICDDLRASAARLGLTRPDQVRSELVRRLRQEFTDATYDPFVETPSCVVFVGINGAGKTTTVGKIAHAAKAEGRRCAIAAGDTFRAAAIEQLEVWAQRAEVPIVSRSRGSDPASVCFDALREYTPDVCDLLLIDTAGRLHTSDELMRELSKVVSVVRKHAQVNVSVVLVLDATTGQNGLIQARQFNAALDLDGVVLTKLDGTAKGGIAVAISSELKLPLFRIGVGESLEDLQVFDADAFCRALIQDTGE